MKVMKVKAMKVKDVKAIKVAEKLEVKVMKAMKVKSKKAMKVKAMEAVLVALPVEKRDKIVVSVFLMFTLFVFFSCFPSVDKVSLSCFP